MKRLMVVLVLMVLGVGFGYGYGELDTGTVRLSEWVHSHQTDTVVWMQTNLSKEQYEAFVAFAFPPLSDEQRAEVLKQIAGEAERAGLKEDDPALVDLQSARDAAVEAVTVRVDVVSEVGEAIGK